MTCAICQMDMEGDFHTLDCGHIFHTTCIVSWFRSGPKMCPICRDEPRKVDNVNLKYIKELVKCRSCPDHLKCAYDFHINQVRDLRNLQQKKKKCKGEPIKKRSLIKKIRQKKKIIRHSKNQMCNSNIFIVPIKKQMFYD